MSKAASPTQQGSIIADRFGGPADGGVAATKFDLIIGADTEYVRGSVYENEIPETDQGKTNAVLCYTVSVIDPKTGQQTSGMIPTKGPTRRHRLSLSGFLTSVLIALEDTNFFRAPARMRIALVFHFSRADLCGFRDFKRLKKRIDSVRNTFASTERPLVVMCRMPSGRTVRLSVTVVDTLLLAPAGLGALKKLGEVLEFPKIELPPGAIERMDLLMESDPALFRRYAIRDAEVAAMWFLKVLEFFATELGVGYKPTLGSAGVEMFTKCMVENGVPLDDFLGHVVILEGRKKHRTWHSRPRDIIPFAADCYHGGRNEAYEIGYSEEGDITDFDIAGAYTTAMAFIRMPDWDGLHETTDLDDIARLDVMTLARVRFRFPRATRFPCLPVRTDGMGLIYPLEGISYCTGPELVVALDLGAEIVAERGVVIPWASDERPFREFTGIINAIRQRHLKKSVFERMAKEIGNSLYGKTGQAVADLRVTPDGGLRAVRGKRVFNSRAGEMQNVPPSKITQPVFAAYITGLIRAVLSELIARLPEDVTVFTATTDGFLSTADRDAVDTTGPVYGLFRELRGMVAETDNILEVKHRVRQVITVKTRGTISVKPGPQGEGGPPVLARAGQRMENPPADKWDESREWVEIYRTRDYDLRNRRVSRIDLQKQWYSDSDLVDVEREVRVNLDPDLKRRPVDVIEREEVFAATTVPWNDIDEFLTCRSEFDNWRQTGRRVLKTAADWDEFTAIMGTSVGRRQAGLVRGRKGLPALAVGIMRAAARGELGFPKGGRGQNRQAKAAVYNGLCDSFAAAGLEITRRQIKDSGRYPVVLGRIVALTEAERALFTEVKGRWDYVEIEALLTPRTKAEHFTSMGIDGKNAFSSETAKNRRKPGVPIGTGLKDAFSVYGAPQKASFSVFPGSSPAATAVAVDASAKTRRSGPAGPGNSPPTNDGGIPSSQIED